MEKASKKLFKIIIVFVLILALTIADFAILGSQVIAYVVGAIEKTNVENVLFSAYFLDESGNKTTFLERDMSSADTKLYMELEVKNQGYFNGQIQISESNFTLKQDITNEYVNSIDSNVINLNQINAGDKILLEFGIDVIKQDEYDVTLIDKTSKIQITGTYTTSLSKDKKINSTRNVQLKLNSPYSSQLEENGVELQGQIVTNKIYQINGENKRIVQVEITSGLQENKYPIKSTKIQVVGLKDAQQVTVSKRETYATNNNKGDVSSNWVKDENKVSIEIQNQESDGKIAWSKSGKDDLLVTYVLDKDVTVASEDIEINGQIELYDKKGTNLNKTTKVVVGEAKDGIISYEINQQQDLYKGYLYNKEESKISSETLIDVRYKDIAGTITVQEGNAKYVVNGKEKDANLQYKLTKVNKNEIINLLGENGKLEIKSEAGNILATITKQSAEQNENEQIDLRYDAQRTIIVEITNSENDGRIKLTHEKVLVETSYTKEQMKQFESLKLEGNISADKNLEKKTTEKIMQLKEPETYATITSSTNTLSTLQTNDNVEFSVVLKSDDAKYELYKNPRVEIEFPQQFKKIDVNSINILNADNELKVSSANMENREDKSVIVITFEGEQLKHKEKAIEGIKIILNLNIDIDRNIGNVNTQIKMNYKNGEKTGVDTEEISIVAPTGIIAINSIENYDLETISTDDTKSAKLDIGDKVKESEVEISVVNNENTDISDVNILGRFPTKGKINIDNKVIENNIETKVVEKINVQKQENTNISIYYSENENASEDLNNAENLWTEDINTIENVKSYLIKVDSLKSGENISATYKIDSEEKIDVNKRVYENYIVTYENSLSKTRNSIEATALGLESTQENEGLALKSDSNGVQLNVNQTAYVGDTYISSEEIVRVGEIIKYSIEIQNKGTKNATNIVIKDIISTNVKLVELVEEEYEEEDSIGFIFNSYFKEKDDTEINFTIDNLDVGQSITKEYYVKVKAEGNVKNNITIGCDGINNITGTNLFEAKNANFDVKLYRTKMPETEGQNGATIIAGDTITYRMVIKNQTNEDRKNVVFELKSGLLQPIEMYYIKDENVVEIEDYDNPSIDEIKANSECEVLITVVANNDKNNNYTEDSISASVINGIVRYNSNALKEKIESTLIKITQTSIAESEKVIDGQKLSYEITVQNIGNIDALDIEIEDRISKYLRSVKVKTEDVEADISVYEDETEEGERNYTDVTIGTNLKVGEVKKYTVETVVDLYEDCFDIENVATVNNGYIVIAESNVVINAIYSEEAEKEEEKEQETTNGKTISGNAWLDKNNNGEKNYDENKLSGIVVKLFNVETGKFEDKDTTTDELGNYKIKNIQKGRYMIVFEYDNTLYALTKYKAEGVADESNSKAILNSIIVDNIQKNLSTTDVITINESDIKNINIGLCEAEEFDMELNKYINKVVVKTQNETNEYNYDNANLAKVEIASKEINGASVIVEYTLQIKNVGEIPGYVKSIVDYIPSDMKFSSELNKEWYQSGKELYNTSFANVEIKPGETKNITLILTKSINDNNIGLTNNSAELFEVANVKNISDKDSTPGNRVKTEDDYSEANLIISIKTGIIVKFVLPTIMLLIIVGFLYIFCIKKSIKFNQILKERRLK